MSSRNAPAVDKPLGLNHFFTLVVEAGSFPAFFFGNSAVNESIHWAPDFAVDNQLDANVIGG